MRPIHCLFDLETIGGRDGAPIVQIGAVLFSPWGQPSDFDSSHKDLLPADARPSAVLLPGDGVISAPGAEFRENVFVCNEDLVAADWSTIRWWLTRTSDEARRRVFADDGRSKMLGTVLREFAFWCNSWGEAPTYWWSDMDFDLRLMRQAWAGMGIPCPFGTDGGPHRGVRDYRTLRWIGKALGIEQAPRVGVEHDALDDAYHQTYYAIRVLRHLGVEK